MFAGITFKEIIAALGGVTAVVGMIVGLAKWVRMKTETTPEQTDAEIELANQLAKQKAEQTGRPE